VKFTGPGDGHVAPPDTARGRLSSAAAKAMAAARGRALRGLRSENWEEIRRLEQRTGGGEAKPREPTPRRSGGDDHHGTTPPPPRSILVVSAREYRTGRWLAFSSLASFSSPAQLLPTTTQHPHRTARRGPLIPRFFYRLRRKFCAQALASQPYCGGSCGAVGCGLAAAPIPSCFRPSPGRCTGQCRCRRLAEAYSRQVDNDNDNPTTGLISVVG
jgi:hypothetical protein